MPNIFTKGAMLLTIDLDVIITKEVYYNPTNNFGVYGGIPANSEDSIKLKYNKYGNITLKGFLPQLSTGQKYSMSLKEIYDQKYGTSYEVVAFKENIPTTPDQQKEYLKAILTPLQVEAIYEVYEGQDIIQLIKEDKFDYTKVKGIGEYTYQIIKEKIINNLELQHVLAELSKYGITYKMIKKLFEHYKSSTLLLNAIHENPYILTEVRGVGFKKADMIARQMGIELDNPHRIHAGIVYVLEQEQLNGNGYMEYDNLLQECVNLLEIDKSKIEHELESQIDKVIRIGDRFALQKVYNAEKYVAQRLLEMNREIQNKTDIDIEKFLTEQMEKYMIQLTDEQKNLFYNFIKYQVNFLIGSAGTGKSQLQKIIINLIRKLNLKCILLAPTGKAAKILEQYTGHHASTIHRAIKIVDDDIEAMNDIYEDVVIVDESSMCDVLLVAKLLNKIKNPNARLLFIGDDYQLPSVGVGNFLYDCINSGVLPVTRLTKVFRQKDGGILDIATRIRHQESFLDRTFYGKKLFGKDLILHSLKQENMTKGYVHYYRQMLNIYSPDDIMILTPRKNGDLGTKAINSVIQELVNPPSQDKKEYLYGNDILFRQGDRIINTQNTYGVKDQSGNEVDIYNGDMGVIKDIDLENKHMIIDYGFAIVNTPFDELDKIIHSYALTIHKSQGSSASCVIIIIDKSHAFQINTNLLYTAVTRAKEKCIILCQASAIENGLKKVANLQRKSFLLEFLKSKIL